MKFEDDKETPEYYLDERIKSQCVIIHFEKIEHAFKSQTNRQLNWLELTKEKVTVLSKMCKWLDERASRLDDIPYYNTGQENLPDITDKWAMYHNDLNLVFWISNNTIRTEFILVWL